MNLPEQDIKEIVVGLKNDNYRFEGKTILITGAFGALGRILISYFLYLNKNVFTQKCKVYMMDNLIISTKMEGIDDENFIYINHDVTQNFGMKLPPNEPIHFILAAAGLANPSDYMRYPKLCLDLCYTGTINCLELAYHRQTEKVLIFSSSEVYGNPDDANIPTKETYNGNISTLADRACYDYGKKISEVNSFVYFKYHGVKSTIIRPFNVFHGNNIDKDKRVLPSFMKAILKKEPLIIYGDGLQSRTYSFAVDFIRGLILTLLHGRPAEAYNIGNPKPEINLIDLTEKMKKVLNIDFKVEKRPYPEMNYPKIEPLRRCPDVSKARDEFGFECKVSLDEGLLRFYNWSKENFKY